MEQLRIFKSKQMVGNGSVSERVEQKSVRLLRNAEIIGRNNFFQKISSTKFKNRLIQSVFVFTKKVIHREWLHKLTNILCSMKS